MDIKRISLFVLLLPVTSYSHSVPRAVAKYVSDRTEIPREMFEENLKDAYTEFRREFKKSGDLKHITQEQFDDIMNRIIEQDKRWLNSQKKFFLEDLTERRKMGIKKVRDEVATAKRLNAEGHTYAPVYPRPSAPFASPESSENPGWWEKLWITIGYRR